MKFPFDLYHDICNVSIIVT